MNSSIFHSPKLLLMSWLYTIIIIIVVLVIKGKQVISWLMMKLYEFFIEHK